MRLKLGKLILVSYWYNYFSAKFLLRFKLSNSFLLGFVLFGIEIFIIDLEGRNYHDDTSFDITLGILNRRFSLSMYR